MIPFPQGKRFAFTILDDTDDATTDSVRPVYDCLQELGLKTTKTLWTLGCPEGSKVFFAGQTLEDKDYLDFVRQLVEKGFELAWHGATMESSDRNRTKRAFDTFRELFGFLPRLHCNHGHNRENMYWGPKRYQSGIVRRVAETYWKFKGYDDPEKYQGEVEGSKYFWGDLCQGHFTYVRNFTFPSLNLLNIDPCTPYSVNTTPFVRYWFSTTDAPDARRFNALVNRTRLSKVIEESGVCIVSTHLGKGFVEDGRLNERTRCTLEWLAQQDGWFVPVSEILDHLRTSRQTEKISKSHLLRLELAHLTGRMRMRLS